MERATVLDALRGAVSGFLSGGTLPDPGDAEAWLRGRVDVVDLRGTPQRDRAKRARRKGRLTPRGITLHQTASWIGSWPDVPCHVGVDRRARVILVQPFDAYLHHAHAINRHSLGFEVECREPGIVGEPRSFWRRKSEREDGQRMGDLIIPATDLQLQAMRHAMVYAAIALDRPLSVWAHRQGDDSRTSDHGERIYRAAVSAASHSPRLAMAPTDTFGTGTAIPRQWRDDGRGVAFAWWDR